MIKHVVNFKDSEALDFVGRPIVLVLYEETLQRCHADGICESIANPPPPHRLGPQSDLDISLLLHLELIYFMVGKSLLSKSRGL